MQNIYILIRRLKATIASVLYYLCRLFAIKKNKIVFSAFEGGGYACNPKYIAKELIKRTNAGHDYELYWLVNDLTKEFPPEIKKVNNTLLNRAYHLATAAVWVDNARKKYGTRKRSGQHYMLTWHGMIGFKPVGRLRGVLFSKIAELVSRDDARNVDLILSNSDWCSRIWHTAFWDEPIAKIGSPRCDILINEREYWCGAIRKRYNLAPDSHIVIYAPTFRGGSQSTSREVFAEQFSLDFDELRRAFAERFGGEWVIMVRLHPQLALRGISVDNGLTDCIDISQVDDLYEILAATDALISDYSSLAFDAAYTYMPVFLYVDDLDDYINDRGKLTWALEDIPFAMARDNSELLSKIKAFNEEAYRERLQSVFTAAQLLEDGRAASRAADIIDDWLQNDKVMI